MYGGSPWLLCLLVIMAKISELCSAFILTTVKNTIPEKEVSSSGIVVFYPVMYVNICFVCSIRSSTNASSLAALDMLTTSAKPHA